MMGLAYANEMKNEPIKALHLNVPCKTKAELDRLVAKGILRWLKKGDVTEWLSEASFMIKPSRGMRLVTYLVHLNRAVERPTQPFALVNGVCMNP